MLVWQARMRIWLVVAFVLAALPVSAQFLPGGCPGRWISYGGGSACQCPNGSLANYVGGAIVCSGGGGGARRSSIPPGATDCGGGRHCKDGLKCASGGKCIAKDTVDCGNGTFCAVGNKCAKQGSGCMPKDSVDCGTFACSAGNVCAANNKCVTEAHARRLRGGGPLEPKAAQGARPSALLASDAYTGSGGGASRLGYRRSSDWEAVLAKSGKSKAEIEEWRKAGFSATVFTKGSAKSGGRRVVIAFKGPEPRGLTPAATRDWIKANWPQEVGATPPTSYVRAAEFAKAVQQQSEASDQISVTGFSIGGTLAAFVGNLLKLETTTFDAPTQSLAPLPQPQPGPEAAPNQTNIITAGDPVSDPLADPDEKKLGAEAHPLPGQTYIVEPKEPKPAHELKSIIKYVDELAGKEKDEVAQADRRSAFDRCVAGWLRRQGGKFAPEGESTSCMDGNVNCVKSKSDVYIMCRQPSKPWAIKPY